MNESVIILKCWRGLVLYFAVPMTGLKAPLVPFPTPSTTNQEMNFTRHSQTHTRNDAMRTACDAMRCAGITQCAGKSHRCARTALVRPCTRVCSSRVCVCLYSHSPVTLSLSCTPPLVFVRQNLFFFSEVFLFFILYLVVGCQVGLLINHAHGVPLSCASCSQGIPRENPC